MTIAAAPSPKIIREVRTAPILSENFSTQTSRTGRLTSWSWRTASLIPYGSPAQAATMSTEACVCCRPSSPDSQHAIDGICRLLVHVLTRIAPISAGERPDLASAARAACSASCSGSRLV